MALAIMGCAAQSSEEISSKPDSALASDQVKTQELHPSDPERVESRLRGQVRASWWHQEAKVELLALTAEQRQRFDDLTVDFVSGNQGIASRRKLRREELAAHIVAGSWQEALRVVDEGLPEEGMQWAAYARYEIEALKQLTDEQRQLFAENFPGMIERPWLRTGAQAVRQGRRAVGER